MANSTGVRASLRPLAAARRFEPAVTIYGVSVKLSDLPPALAEAVRVARATLLPVSASHGLPEPVITDPDLRDWVREYSRSGELAAAIADVARSDADLAG